MLERVNSPADLKRLHADDIEDLCAELRERIVNVVAKNGGHLSSNLGVVELTVAIHRVFNSPEDKIIFDVGHQSYVHKILTGRDDDFDTLRQYGGITGFTNREESEHDPFGCGHASTSVSAAVGIAAANKIKGDKHHVIAVVGDGALTGGMVYEALNNCADKDNLIILLNDNEMSISKNVGGLHKYLTRVRTSAKYFGLKAGIKHFFGAIPLIGKGLVKISQKIRNGIKRLFTSQNMFEIMGLKYYGPLDGNDEKRLETVLREAARDGKCSVVHVITKKGKGYAPAEYEPSAFHGVSGFDIESGKINFSNAKTFSTRFGEIVSDAAANDRRVCVITAAMGDGTGLKRFEKVYPERFFDVGIAEEHAATFAAGLASSGVKPIFAVYSTFAQRAFDQIIHDVALQKLPVVFALDRAGFVGADGPTHHGLFDVAMMMPVPGMRIYACESFGDMEYAFKKALQFDAPTAVRYARGVPADYDRAIWNDLIGVQYCDFGKIPTKAIITYGRLCFNALDAALSCLKAGEAVRVIKLIDIKPLDMSKIKLLLNNIYDIVFVEEGMRVGGVAEALFADLGEQGLLEGKRFRIRAVENRFVPVGTNAELDKLLGFDADSISKLVLDGEPIGV